MPDNIDIIIEDERWEAVKLLPLAQAALTPLFAELELADCGAELCILACDDTRIAALNAEFRDKPKPTNVLSWPAFDLGPVTAGEKPARPPLTEFENNLGDIALSFDTCSAEAKNAGKPFKDHVSHLIIHGCLHLLGYDHETDEDASVMEGLETALLERLGLDDPYA